MKKPNLKTALLFSVLAGSLVANIALAYCYVHYVVQIDNVFTIGAQYLNQVTVSYWNTQAKLDEFNVQAGQVLGRGLANLYWGEMAGWISRYSPIINVTNTSPDKVTNMTWVLANAISLIDVKAYYITSPSGSMGELWLQGTAGAKRLAIGESFQVLFILYRDSNLGDGTYSFNIDVRCED